MRIFLPLRGACWLSVVMLAACHHAGGRAPAPEQAPVVAPAPITVVQMRPAPTVIPLLYIPLSYRPDSHELAAWSLLVSGIDVSFAELAPGRTTQRDVLAYARRVGTDHAALSTQLRDILAQIGLSARDDEFTRDLRQRSAEQHEILAGLSRRAFDTTYARIEVDYHSRLLQLIDRVLLPDASRPELREYLTALRPAVSAHLAHAEQVRAALAARR